VLKTQLAQAGRQSGADFDQARCYEYGHVEPDLARHGDTIPAPARHSIT